MHCDNVRLVRELFCYIGVLESDSHSLEGPKEKLGFERKAWDCRDQKKSSGLQGPKEKLGGLERDPLASPTPPTAKPNLPAW